jgi:hypothetical protein
MKYLKYCLSLLVIFISMIFGCQNATSEKDNQKNNDASNIERKLHEKMIESKIKAGRPWSNEKLWAMINENGSHTSFSAKINEKVDELNFKLIGRVDKHKIFIPSHVEIRNLSDGKLIQKIIIGDKFDKEAIGYSEMDLGIADMVQLVDVNFDGYLDFRTLLYTGATGCNSYATCLYNPTLKKFVFNKKLSEMSALRVDSNSKEIVTYDRGGWCDELMRYYEVSDNKFMLTKVEWTTSIIENVCSPQEETLRLCYKLTGIPLQGHAITDNDSYDFLDEKGRLRKKMKIIKREELHGSLDGRRRGVMGVPIQ